MPTSRLDTKTREALATRPRTLTYEIIAQECGLTVRWIQQYASGKIKDPGVSKVEPLYEILTGNTLNV